jgi:hypothetical protein
VHHCHHTLSIDDETVGSLDESLKPGLQRLLETQKKAGNIAQD